MSFVNMLNIENINDFHFQMFANDNVDIDEVLTVEFEEYTENHRLLMVIQQYLDFLRRNLY